MTAILIALNIIAGLFLIAVVLLQTGKGAEMGAAFGGANVAVFGPSGSGNLLTRATAVCAALFMGSSLLLAVLSARQSSVFDGTAEPAPLAAPADQAPAAVEAQAEATPPVEPDPAAATASLEDALKQAAQRAVQDAAGAAAGAPAAGAGVAAQVASPAPAGEPGQPQAAAPPEGAVASPTGSAPESPSAAAADDKTGNE